MKLTYILDRYSFARTKSVLDAGAKTWLLVAANLAEASLAGTAWRQFIHPSPGRLVYPLPV